MIDFSMYLKNEEDIGNKERYDFLKLFHILYFSLKYDFWSYH